MPGPALFFAWECSLAARHNIAVGTAVAIRTNWGIYLPRSCLNQWLMGVGVSIPQAGQIWGTCFIQIFGVPSGIKPQLPTVMICLISNPIFNNSLSYFPSLPLPPQCPETTSQINHWCSNPGLRVCFWGNPTGFQLALTRMLSDASNVHRFGGKCHWL